MTQNDYLRKEILKTGYPLEITVSSMLDNQWQYVQNTASYYDGEEKKLRDIDITASNFLENQHITPISLRTTMVIECKKNESYAWVFFTRPFKFSNNEIEGQYLDKVQSCSKNYENTQIMDTVTGKTPLHYKQLKRVGVAYTELRLGSESTEKGDKHKRVIFEAQNQIKKFIDCYFDQVTRYGSKRPLNLIDFCFPCIVFDGPLYEAIVEDTQLQLKEADHLVLTTSYRSSFAVFDRSVLIDIVSKRYFQEYAKMVLKERKAIEKTIRTNASALNKRIDEVIDLLGPRAES